MENNKQYFYILHTKDLKNVVKIIATDHQLKPGDKELDAFPLFGEYSIVGALEVADVTGVYGDLVT